MRLTLPVPPGVNAMYRTWRGRVLLSKEGREYKARAALLARAQGARPLAGLRLQVILLIYRPRKAGDIDGYLKGCFDALNGVAWEDDSQVAELHVHRRDDKEDPRLEIEVSALADLSAFPYPSRSPAERRKLPLGPTPKPRPLHPKRNLKRLVLTPAVYRKGTP